MGFLKGVRMALLLAIMVIAIGFSVLNPGERVRIDLFFTEPFPNVPLVFVLFTAFLLGVLGGFMVAVLKIVELQAQLRLARKSQSKIAGELTTLRNLPLEEAEENLPQEVGSP